MVYASDRVISVARKILMTWVPTQRRWIKKHRGKMYSVSCRQLGRGDTKDASAHAANRWWDEKLKEIEAAPPSEEERKASAFKLWRTVQDWGQLDEASREALVDSLVGAGQYKQIKSQAEAMVDAAAKTPPADRTVSAQVDAWRSLLRAACQSRQISEGRFDAYSRKIKPFVAWLGPGTAIDAIDEVKLEGFYAHLTQKVGAGDYAPATAHELLMTAKQFISRLAELKLIALPGNIRSRRFRFNHSAPAKIETFTADEIRAMLAACDGFSDRTKLFLLLMLNCGMYQNYIAELRADEIDWNKGTIRRSRSKTRERGGPVVTYRLWPETIALLKKHRAKGELALATDEGNPLVKYWLEDGAMRRYDSVQSAWSRLATKMGLQKHRLGLKHLRKTASSLLATHPRFKFYCNHFLADSPRSVADSHYVVPSDAEFFEALDWLRLQILPKRR